MSNVLPVLVEIVVSSDCHISSGGCQCDHCHLDTAFHLGQEGCLQFGDIK